MKTEKGIAVKARYLLENLLDARIEVRALDPDRAWDEVLHLGGHAFGVQYISRTDRTAIMAAIFAAQQTWKVEGSDNPGPRAAPLVVVPQMGQTGRELCDRHHIAWLDLAGNARIVLPGLRIIVEGKKLASKPRADHPNFFAPKSSRIAHAMLLEPQRAWTQKELVERTGLGKGFVSRIVQGLHQDRLLKRDEKAYRLADSMTLLQAWHEAYRLPEREIARGLLASTSGRDPAAECSHALRRAGIDHVLGGLSAAKLHGTGANDLLATVHLRDAKVFGLADTLGYREVSRSDANILLVQRADEVAFMGRVEIGGLPVASHVFTYVDLSAHDGAAAEESARHLLEQWSAIPPQPRPSA